MRHGAEEAQSAAKYGACMDLKRLRYFCSVVEHGNMTKAAEALHMAQPPLSKRLQELEEEVGAQLFERSGRTLQPTAAGYHLYQRAGTILREVEDATKETIMIGRRQAKILRVGLTHLYQRHFSKMLLALPRNNPELEIQITVADSGQLERMLHNRSIDVAMIQRPRETAGLSCIDLPPVRMVAVASPMLQLPEGLKVLSMADLQNYPLVLLKRGHGPGIYESLRDHFRKIGISPQIVMSVSQPEAILAWIQSGLKAVALLPASEVGPGHGDYCHVFNVATAPMIFSPAVVKLTTTSFPEEVLRVLEDTEAMKAD